MIVTGRHGQVARSLVELTGSGQFEVVVLGRPELDLATPQQSIISAIEAAEPDVIVSAAAYTHVDQAETDSDQAFAVNAAGPQALARAARELQVPLIHLSTDYVFDGAKASPY